MRMQHAGPILALGAARAGMHFEITIVGIGLAREQRFELASRDLRFQLAQSGFCFGDVLSSFSPSPSSISVT